MIVKKTSIPQIYEFSCENQYVKELLTFYETLLLNIGLRDGNALVFLNSQKPDVLISNFYFSKNKSIFAVKYYY